MRTITTPVDSIAPIWAACQGNGPRPSSCINWKAGKGFWPLSFSHFHMVLTSLHHPYVFNHRSRRPSQLASNSRCPLREVHHENREMMHSAPKSDSMNHPRTSCMYSRQRPTNLTNSGMTIPNWTSTSTRSLMACMSSPIMQRSAQVLVLWVREFRTGFGCWSVIL